MDLIDKYLDGVRPLLPGAQRDDIAQELDGVLRGRMEDRAAELGRPLTRAEQEAVLNDYGHPILVAARYGTQEALIGPELTPLWWMGAKAALIVDAVLHVARGVAVLATAPESPRLMERLGGVWSGFFSVGLMLIGALTVSLMVVERFKLRPFGQWKASDANPFPAGPLARAGRRPGRVTSGGNLLGSLFGLAFWAALPWIRHWGPMIFGGAIIAPISALEMGGVELGPVWFPTLWLMVLAGTLVQTAAYAAEFLWPSERGLPLLLRLVAALLGAATGLTALLRGPLFIATGPLDRKLSSVENLGEWFTLGLWVTTALYAAWAVWYAWRYWSLRRDLASARV